MTIPPKAQSGDGAEDFVDALANLLITTQQDHRRWLNNRLDSGLAGLPETDGQWMARAVISAIRERMLGEKAVEAACRAVFKHEMTGWPGMDRRESEDMYCKICEPMVRAALAAAVGALGVGE